MKYANAIPYPLLKVTLINVYECGISRSFKMQKFRNTIGGGRRPPDFGSPDSKKNAFCYARSRLLKTWMGALLCCEACLKGMQHHWLDLGPILEPKATKIVLPLLQRFGQANRFGIPIKISILFTSLCRQFMTFFLLYTQEVSPLKTSIFGAKIQTSVIIYHFRKKLGEVWFQPIVVDTFNCKTN